MCRTVVEALHTHKRFQSTTCCYLPRNGISAHFWRLFCGHTLSNNLERPNLDESKPPDDLTAAGALCGLCGTRVGNHDGECGARVPFQLEGAAIPHSRSEPIDTFSRLPLSPVSWQRRGVALWFVTRERLPPFVPSWKCLVALRTQRWCGVRPETAIFCTKLVACCGV